MDDIRICKNDDLPSQIKRDVMACIKFKIPYDLDN